MEASVLQIAGPAVSASRSELAHRRHGKSHDRVVELGQALTAAFEDYYGSMQELRDEFGIEVTPTFDFPLREAWFDWRAKRQLADMDGKR
jgi:hypothetical protein